MHQRRFFNSFVKLISCSKYFSDWIKRDFFYRLKLKKLVERFLQHIVIKGKKNLKLTNRYQNIRYPTFFNLINSISTDLSILFTTRFRWQKIHNLDTFNKIINWNLCSLKKVDLKPNKGITFLKLKKVLKVSTIFKFRKAYIYL